MCRRQQSRFAATRCSNVYSAAACVYGILWSSAPMSLSACLRSPRRRCCCRRGSGWRSVCPPPTGRLAQAPKLHSVGACGTRTAVSRGGETVLGSDGGSVVVGGDDNSVVAGIEGDTVVMGGARAVGGGTHSPSPSPVSHPRLIAAMSLSSPRFVRSLTSRCVGSAIGRLRFDPCVRSCGS